jgi:hypothetical protein
MWCRLHVCFDKGPKGSPTYDKSGFELDWDAVAHWMEPQTYNKAKMMRNMDRAVDKAQEDAKKMAAIFFREGGGAGEARVLQWRELLEGQSFQGSQCAMA